MPLYTEKAFNLILESFFGKYLRQQSYSVIKNLRLMKILTKKKIAV